MHRAAATSARWRRRNSPPLYLEDPVRAQLTQRGGVDVELLSGVGINHGNPANQAVGGSVTIGQDASIDVDPGRAVRIASGGQITVNGRITAPGGSISIVNNSAISNSGAGARSIWIGDNAMLDVAARAYIARDGLGRAYGIVPDGGTISLGSDGGINASTYIAYAADAFVVIRPGAVLDASGTVAEIDLSAGTNPATSRQPVIVASDGGSITLRSYDGLYVEGTVLAASGGAGASGGSLALILESPIYGYGTSATEVPASLRAGRVLFVGQDAVPGALLASATAGQVDPSLVIGHGAISARQIDAGGFDSVALWGRTAIAFDGDVALHVGRSIALQQGAIYDTVAGGNVTLALPMSSSMVRPPSLIHSAPSCPRCCRRGLPEAPSVSSPI